MQLKNISKSINKKFLLYSFLALNISTIFGMEDQSLSNDINSNYDNSSITSHNQSNNNWVKFKDYKKFIISIENNFKKNFLINDDDNNKHVYLNNNIDKKNNSENSNNIDVNNLNNNNGNKDILKTEKAIENNIDINNLNNNNGNKDILKTEKEIENNIDINSLLINKYKISDICKMPINNDKNNETKNKLLKKKKYRDRKQYRVKKQYRDKKQYRWLKSLSNQNINNFSDEDIVKYVITCYNEFLHFRLNKILKKDLNKKLRSELEKKNISEFEKFSNINILSCTDISTFLHLPIRYFCSTCDSNDKKKNNNAIIIRTILKNSKQCKNLFNIFKTREYFYFFDSYFKKKLYEISKENNGFKFAEKVKDIIKKIKKGGIKTQIKGKNNIINKIKYDFINIVGFDYKEKKNKKVINKKRGRKKNSLSILCHTKNSYDNIVKKIFTKFKENLLSKLNGKLQYKLEDIKKFELKEHSKFFGFLNLAKFTYAEILDFLHLPIKFPCSITADGKVQDKNNNAKIVRTILENSEQFIELSQMLERQCIDFFKDFINNDLKEDFSNEKDKVSDHTLDKIAKDLIEGTIVQRVKKNRKRKDDPITFMIENFKKNVGIEYINKDDKKYIENRISKSLMGGKKRERNKKEYDEENEEEENEKDEEVEENEESEEVED